MTTPDKLLDILLGDAPNDVIEAELEALSEWEETFHLLALSEAPTPPSQQAKARLMLALDPVARFEPYVARLMEILDLTRGTILSLLQSLDEPSTLWEPGPCEGSQLIHLPAGPRFGGALAGFIRVEAEVQFPHHRHEGFERVFVLQGALRDSDGTVLRPGDERLMDKETEHDFVVLSGPPLIYVVALGGQVHFRNNEM